MTRNIMKGNFKRKVSILLLLLCFCLVKSTWAQEVNCGNQISLKEVKASEVTTSTGSIIISVVSSGKFEAQLFEISGMGKQLLSTQLGELSQEIVFQKIKNSDNLQVLVTFLDEKGGWCKRRQISEIKTSDK